MKQGDGDGSIGATELGPRTGEKRGGAGRPLPARPMRGRGGGTAPGGDGGGGGTQQDSQEVEVEVEAVGLGDSFRFRRLLGRAGSLGSCAYWAWQAGPTRPVRAASGMSKKNLSIHHGPTQPDKQNPMTQSAVP